MEKPKYLELTPDDLEKVNKNRAKHESIRIDSEQMFIAEFGKHYGWGGVQAILSNEIDGETAVWLLQGARKFNYSTLYDNARAAFIGSVTSQSKKPSTQFKRVTRDLIKAMEADV